MKVYYLRHAEAVDGADDAARPLSDHGQEQCRELGEFLSRAKITFEAAYSSPLVRAHETAKLVLPITNKKSPVRVQLVDELLNETAWNAFGRWLESLTALRNCLLVGHDPSISQRLRRLLQMTNAEALSMPKAGLACIALEENRAPALKFLITPKSLGL
jgi:phosphohistidine phosphatase SixA